MRLLDDIRTVLREAYRTAHPDWYLGYAVYIDGDCAHWYEHKFMAITVVSMYLDGDRPVDVFTEWRKNDVPTDGLRKDDDIEYERVH